VARIQQQEDEARVDVLLAQLEELLLPLLGLVKIIGRDGVCMPATQVLGSTCCLTAACRTQR